MRKKSKKLLLIDYEQLSREEVVATISEMTVRLFELFKYHIGVDESLSPVEVFEQVIGIHPEQMSIYKRDYWWKIIRRIMSQLRSAEELFIIHRGQKWFVLKDEFECRGYKDMLDRDIKAIKNSKKKADKWVKEKRWQHI